MTAENKPACPFGCTNGVAVERAVGGQWVRTLGACQRAQRRLWERVAARVYGGRY